MTLEEELKQIDFEIRRLKIQYDLYFYGTLARPPNDQRDALARQVRRLQGVEMRNMADRFLYNNVVNKFNTFVELWAKLLRNKEEGSRTHPLAARTAQRAARAELGGSRPKAQPAEARHRDPAPTFRIAAGHGPDPSLRGLYDSFVAARQAAGDGRSVGFDTFAREVARQAAAIKGKADCESVEFTIYSRDNKVTLKARPSGRGR